MADTTLSPALQARGCTYRTPEEIVAAADWRCRDGYRSPASDESQLDQLTLALEVAMEQRDVVRGRELLKQIKEMEAR